MAPIFALVVETFVQHLHDFNEIVSISSLLVQEIRSKWKGNALIVCHLRNLVHLSARGAPWIVGSGLANFSLDIGVTFCVILRDT